jgi:GNAT superfamily N-acetyltransferase
MAYTLAPFAPAHLEAAAALLAARHRSDRAAIPDLPAAFEDDPAVCRVLRDLLANDAIGGVAAFRDDALAGFMLGAPDFGAATTPFAGFMHPRSAEIAFEGFAGLSDGAEELYRRMYAALADRWLAQGLAAHYVTCPFAGDAIETWLDLGFARFIEMGARDTRPPVDCSGACTLDVEYRRASPDDADAIHMLTAQLFQSFADPPICLPYLPETEPGRRQLSAELLADPSCPHWLAFAQGRLIGMHIFVEPDSPQWHLAKLQAPERCVYLFLACTDPAFRSAGVGAALFAQGMEWARDAGYERCAVHYLTASRAARFWRGLGFRPVSLWLRRSIDDRMLWSRRWT